MNASLQTNSKISDLVSLAALGLSGCRISKEWLNLMLLTGAIPPSLDAQVVMLGHNLLAGSIPERLLGGRERPQKWVVANALEVAQK
eukprot:5636238-Amphidinium_carterae.1